jgi:hypothetical protein
LARISVLATESKTNAVFQTHHLRSSMQKRLTYNLNVLVSFNYTRSTSIRILKNKRICYLTVSKTIANATKSLVVTVKISLDRSRSYTLKTS